MNQALTPRPRQFGPRRTIAIVASEFNTDYVQGLVDHAAKEIETSAPSTTILLRQVPGAFEIPLLVQEFATRENTHAILALGVVIQGETQHARLICESVTRSLHEISLANRIPVVHGVLLLENEKQARERCLGDRINRGTEAARVALSMIQIMADIKEKGRF